MKVNVVQSVRVGGKDYKLGIHEMPDHLKSDEGFNKALKYGFIRAAKDETPVSAVDLQQQQKKINDKLIADSKEASKKAQEKAKSEPVDESFKKRAIKKKQG